MSGWGVAGSIFGQLMLGYMLFMLAVFAGGGIANGNKLSRWQMFFLNASIYGLPASSVISIVMLWVAYKNQLDSVAYWWNIIPIIALCFYLFFVRTLGKNR